jgi:hypothetical protein
MRLCVAVPEPHYFASGTMPQSSFFDKFRILHFTVQDKDYVA